MDLAEHEQSQRSIYKMPRVEDHEQPREKLCKFCQGLEFVQIPCVPQREEQDGQNAWALRTARAGHQTLAAVTGPPGDVVDMWRRPD